MLFAFLQEAKKKAQVFALSFIETGKKNNSTFEQVRIFKMEC